VPLAHLPTPVLPLDRLGRELGLPEGTLLAKHDDLTGLAGGGNKVRKLEYLCADALEQGCDVLVTGGGRQSNHARLTAAAAARLGLDCHLVLASDRPDEPTGNVVLDEALAPAIEWVGRRDYYGTEAAIREVSDRLADEGRRPYRVPVGGASAVGALGYVRAARELLEQVPDVDVVVVADGSGGTQAGLVAGFGDHDRVLGIDVGTRPDLEETVPETATETALLAGLDRPTGEVRVDHTRYGEGYGVPTDTAREALDLAGRLEGMLVDPVYTAKALAGLIGAVREGSIRPGRRVVFLHTGGLPALLATRYAQWVRERP